MPLLQEALLHPTIAPDQKMDCGSLGSSRAFFVVLLLFLLALECAAYFYLLPHRVAQVNDFRQLYTAGYMLRTDPAHLYDIQRQMEMQAILTSTRIEGILASNHAPFEALFLLPLSHLSYACAYMVMMAINVALIAICFFSLRPLFSATIPMWQPRPGLMFFAFLPVPVAVMNGQDSLLFLAICCLTLYLLRKEQDFFAGILLSVTLFKPQISLPIAILVTARRGWKFLAGFATGSTSMLLLCLRLVHLDGLRQFLHVVAYTNAAGLTKTAQTVLGTSPLEMPDLHGLLFFITSRWLPHNAELPIVVIASLAALLWAMRGIRRIALEETAFAYAITWAILLSYLDHISDLPLWLIPLAVLATLAGASRLKSLVIDTAFVLPACIAFLHGITHFYSLLWTLSVPLFATAVLLERARPTNTGNTALAAT